MSSEVVEITQEIVRRHLNYDPDTGVFTWREPRSTRVQVGSVAGFKHTWGYLQISLFSRAFLAHRLAWMYVYGSFPEGHLDHANGLRSDNRINNLRQATVAQNLANRGPTKRNKCGIKGVRWNDHSKKWMAQITKDYAVIPLGFLR